MDPDNFTKSLAVVLQIEGGEVDDKNDRGGRTNEGVTQVVYDGWRANHNLPRQDVWLMSHAERDDIYRKQYWAVIRGEQLPLGVSLFVFDGAVHSGNAQAAKWLQRALGVTVDGHIGEATIAAAKAHPDPRKLIDDMAARRLAFLQQLKPWPIYKNGWSNRVADVSAQAKALALGEPTLATLRVTTAPRALISDAVPAPAVNTGTGLTASGVGAGGLAALIHNAQESLAPLVRSSELIGKIVAALVLAGVIVGVIGFVRGWLMTRKAAAHADALDLPGAPT